MALLTKHAMPAGTLLLQDDHYRRINDLCFRHLSGAWSNYLHQIPHNWIDNVSNEDPGYGNAEYLKSLSDRGFLQSEEYSQSIASALFAHIWLLSAANYYRLAIKLKNRADKDLHDKQPIERTHSPTRIAEDLGLSDDLCELAEELHNARNTITHLIEDNRDAYPLSDLGFEQAYMFVEGSWKIYCALIDHYGRSPDHNHWKLQTDRYGLPNSLTDAVVVAQAQGEPK